MVILVQEVNKLELYAEVIDLNFSSMCEEVFYSREGVQ